MSGKISMQMNNALKLYAQGVPLTDAARKACVTPRGLRYALLKKKNKKGLDRVK
jgi:hypothetical protein